MEPHVILTCGCAASGRHTGAHDGLPTGHPSCAVHLCCTVAPVQPDLNSRMALCAYSNASRPHEAVPSRSSLPFFEYRGEGSREATQTCGRCGFSRSAHDLTGEKRPAKLCEAFTPKGAQPMDSYYCGCRGWD